MYFEGIYQSLGCAPGTTRFRIKEKNEHHMNSLKSTLFLFLLCLTPVLLQAQISVGLKAGYTTAWEYYNSDLPDDAQIDVNGFNVSAMAYKPLGKHLAIGIEPGFVKRGAACIPGWEPIFASDTKFILNYLEAPAMLSGKLPLFKGKLEALGKVGYGVSWLATAFAETTFFLPETPVTRDQIVLRKGSLLNRVDHGAYAGLGIAVPFGPGKVLLESDFYLGLRDAERFNTSQNRSVDLSLGYVISLGGK